MVVIVPAPNEKPTPDNDDAGAVGKAAAVADDNGAGLDDTEGPAVVIVPAPNDKPAPEDEDAGAVVCAAGAVGKGIIEEPNKHVAEVSVAGVDIAAAFVFPGVVVLNKKPAPEVADVRLLVVAAVLVEGG